MKNLRFIDKGKKMRNVRKIMRMFYLKEAVISWLVFYMALLLPAQIVMANPSPAADALPSGLGANQGIATPEYLGSTMNLTQTSNQAIANWQNFDIGSNATVNINQPSANAALLNRISDGSATGIMGALNANGRVFIINPAGVLFGSGSKVNVTQLVASSLDITDADFLNGAPYTFTGGQGEMVNGDVINEGSINAERIALIGRNVTNRGILMADKSVIMAAGDQVILSETGGKVSVVANVGEDWIPNNNYQVRNDGKEGIQVNGDDVQVILAAGDIWSSAYIGASGNGTASVVMKADGDIEIDDNVEINAYIDSPAVATLEMTAGEDIMIKDEVELYAYGSESENATATINVDAGGNVYVYAYGEDEAGLSAEAEGLNTNTARITIHAGANVEVNAEDYSDAFVYAGTYGGRINNSSVDVAAGGNVRVDAYNDAWAGIEAEAYAYPYPEGSVTNTVSTTINAGGKVVAQADYDSEVDIDSEAWNGTNNTATTSITAGEYVKANATDYSDADIEAEAHGGTKSNTATVNITVTGVENSENYQNGGVYVIADYGSHAEMQALADAEIYYPEYSYQVVGESSSYGLGTAVNTANLIVNAAQDVEVTAEGEYTDASLNAEAKDGRTNTAAAIIHAGGDVKVHAAGWDSDAFLGADAGSKYLYSNTNTANVTVNAGGNVCVAADGQDEGYARSELAAYAEDAYSTEGAPAGNTANADITANNVVAFATADGEARIKARAAYAYTDQELIPASDVIMVQQENGFEPDGSSNTANLTIHTFKIEMEQPQSEPEPQPSVASLPIGIPSEGLGDILADYVDGGHVAAVALNGGDAQIEAVAFGSNYGQSAPTNKSGVLICAEGAVVSAAVNCQKNDGETWSNAEISSLANFGFENSASLGIGAKQGVGVLAMGDGTNSSISSTAMNGYANNARLVACTAGPAAVLAYRDGDASMVSKAYDGNINNAYTGVCADSLVVVGAAYEGRSEIASYAGISGSEEIIPLAAAIAINEKPSSSTAQTAVISKNSGVAVMALEEGSAGISSTAVNAYTNDAYTGVCAKDHIIVAAGVDEFFNDGGYDSIKIASSEYGGSGGTAYISSEAGNRYFYSVSAAEKEAAIEQSEGQTTSNAKTTVVSHEGGVIVADMTDYEYVGSASISSLAMGSHINNAYTGVAAGADLSPASLDDELLPPDEEPATIIERIEWMYRYNLPIDRGEVGIYAEGPGSYAVIKSEAFSPYSTSTSAQTVVCAPGEVSIESDGWEGYSHAGIQSYASGSYGTNKASTQVYASEVYLDENGYNADSKISAMADSAEWLYVELAEGSWSWTAGESEPILWTSEEGVVGTTTLIINSYGSRQDCPDCPPCPDCPCQDEGGVFAPVAPLAQFELPRIEGCPALTQAAAQELGIAAETLQVAIGNALAMNPNIQPCQACSTLVNAAAVLRDADGSRMAAMAYVFNQIAPADAPFTPEMGAAIATAFSQNAQTDARYASAMEYVDAFVKYVTVVDRDLNAPIGGDAVAFAMNKYGNAMTQGGNANMAAYILSQMPQQ
jgi:filamentous hemagglutinin family protein